MGKKSRLINELENFQAVREELENRSNRIMKDNSYTIEFKNKKVTEFEAERQGMLKGLNNNVTDILNSKRAELERQDKNTFDISYQTRLSNVLKILELGNLKPGDIKAMIEPFKDDPISLEGFRGALRKQGKDDLEIMELIPMDVRSETLKRLEAIERYLSKEMLDKETESTMSGFKYLGLEMTLNKLDDDLSYKGQ